MTSVTQICNRGLQHLGAARILDITDDNRNGRACNAAYDSVRKRELRKHRWRFAIKREAVAPLVETDPLGEFAYIFQLPADCLRILKPRDPTLDWSVEGRKLYTSQSDVLNLRFIKDETDPNIFDAMFAEVLSILLAHEMCEEITQSNTKKANLMILYKNEISEAKKINAFETIPKEPEDDPWVLARF